jgi:hypothetical protein
VYCLHRISRRQPKTNGWAKEKPPNQAQGAQTSPTFGREWLFRSVPDPPRLFDHRHPLELSKIGKTPGFAGVAVEV